MGTVRQGRSDMCEPAANAVVIVKSDTINLVNVPTFGIYVGGTGDVSVEMEGIGTAIIFSAVPVGAVLPIRVTRVNSTGTTATLMVGLF